MSTEQGISGMARMTSAIRPVSIAPDVWLAARPVSVERAPVTNSDLRAASGMARREAQRFLVARGLLRKLVARIRPAAATVDVVYTEKGTPGLAGHDDLAVSVSHDGEWVAAVAGRTSAVGVDVQEPVPGTANRLESLDAYLDQLVHLSNRQRDVELAWVRSAQEACLKARGDGASGRPSDVDIPPFSVAGRWGDLLWRSPRSLSTIPLSAAFTLE